MEKPGPEEIETNLINAGAYILERDVLADMAPAGPISIEREVFPELVGHGLYGYEASGYWLDIGTPDRYLQATFDILEGDVHTEVGAPSPPPAGSARGGPVAGPVHGPALVGAGCGWRHAILGGRTVLGRDVPSVPGPHRLLRVLDGCRGRRRYRISRIILGPGRDDRRALSHRRPGGHRRGRDVGRQHAHRRHAYLPGRGTARRSHRVLSTDAD